MNQKPWRVVITDCDHGSIEEEKEEFNRIGAELILAQVKEEEELIRVCKEADGLINQYAPLKRRAAEIVSAVLFGKWPKSVVNPEVMGKTRAFISKP